MCDPAPPVCLTRSYSSSPSQRGGTLIAEDVIELEQHERLLFDPDGYRPSSCPSCGHHRLHAHDYRHRKLRGESESSLVVFRRYRCVACRGVWQVLAGFMARCLHRRWPFVERAVGRVLGREEDTCRSEAVPRRTLQRWISRLLSSARVVIQAFAAAGVDLGLTVQAGSRWDLLKSMVVRGLLSSGRRMAELAGWLHRLVPGLRLA
jgi:transposase-like protein